VRQRLSPGAAERDEGFRQEILRIGHSGLRAVGGVEIGVAAFLVGGRLMAAPLPATLRLRLLEAAVPLALGAVTIALSRMQDTYAWSRALGWVSCFLAAAALNWFSLLWRNQEGAIDFVLGPVTALVLVAVAAIPLRPMHTLGLGCAIGASYEWFAHWLTPLGGPQPAYGVFVLLLTLLATGLTAVVYGERHAAYESWLGTMRALEDLRQAQSKILLSENAASLGRLAAALSHELNSPLGALMSAVDTLVLLAAKQAVSPPEGQERLVRLQADLRRSVQESARRIQQIVERMQRFTNLDRAEVQEVNLNGLLGDVHALVDPRTANKVALELDLAPVPPLRCRPLQLSAVFSSLLNNAIGAVACGGRIVVTTRQRDARIEVEIRDDGCGMAPKQLQTIFDPGFRVAEDRVVSGNWSMFGARQIVREHGGDIRIASGEGRGTTVTVTLPLNNREIRR
jgi:signal transduction histidine kinase